MNHPYVRDRIVIAEPQGRGGTSTTTVQCEDQGAKFAAEPSFAAKMLRQLHGDSNLSYLAARLRNYGDQCDLRLIALKHAAQRGDTQTIAQVAHALADCSGRLGAIRMMKICIGVHLLGRRGQTARIGVMVDDLEREYERFKQSLIPGVK